MIWNFIIKLVLVAVISYALRPKPQTLKPATLDELDVPSTELGRTIKKLWGRRRCVDPHLGWYGDLKTEAIRK